MVEKIKKNKKIKAFSDLYFSPISFKDTALLSLKITKKKLSGIFHLSGKKDYNYYQFAKMLAVKLGKNKN